MTVRAAFKHRIHTRPNGCPCLDNSAGMGGGVFVESVCGN